MPRLRLFGLLDAAQEQPLVWISGPPGAGKTTLAASYVSAKKRPGIWYQVDRGDGDIATFFYYLGLAVANTKPRKRIDLPLLTPEYLPDIEGFTRRFFRKAYASLPSGSVIVFDNYQEVEADSPFHPVMAWASSEIPEGVRVMAISRSEPPAHYSRHRANSLIAQIDWRDLRLTLDETILIAKGRHAVGDELLQALHHQSDGWAAAVVLMLERLKQTGTMSAFTPTESTDTLFDYFVAQIFEQLGEGTREVLLRTSILPRVTIELAQAMSGRSDVARVLEELYREQFLVDRRAGATVTYQYHALFGAFLRAQAKHRCTDVEWRALLVASADALARYGQSEEAVPVFIAAGAHERAIPLILMQAQPLLTLGRWGTLQQWIERAAYGASGASALNRAWYAARLGFAMRYMSMRSPNESRSWFQQARQIVREHGLRFLEAPIAIYWAWSEEVFGDVADLERELGIAKTHLNPSSHFEAAFHQTGLAFLCVRHGDHNAAVSHLSEAAAFFRQSGSTLGQAASFSGLTGTLLDSNDVAGARDALEGALSVLIQGPLRLYLGAMSRAAMALRLSDAESTQANLRVALSLGRRPALAGCRGGRGP
ncbi:MAG: hypothetical protein ACT4QB_01235 [Gammaproteobacteria bacterium]